MATEDFCFNLSPLPSPRWSPLCFPPSPPRPFLPSSSSMVMKYQGSNQSMDNPSQNQESDDMVDPAPYLAGDSALLQQLRQNWIEASDWRPRGGIMTMNNQGFEESNMGFYFLPSLTDFPLYPPLPSVFFGSSNIQDISLAFSYQHILEDKSGALHVLNAVEFKDIGPMFEGFGSYVVNKFGDLDPIARAAGLVPEDMESLVNNILNADYDYDEREVTLRRINWLEQHDEDIVDQPVYELVGVAHQLIQNRGGELDVIIGGGVFKINGLECSDDQGSPMSPETLLIFQAKCSFRVWLGHDGQCVAETRFRCSRLNIGSFTTVEDAVSAYELVVRSSGWEDLTRFLGLLGNENRSKLPLQLPPPAQEEKPNEDFGLVCCNAMGNDEIEAFGTGSARTGDCVMADQARLNSGYLGKRKTNGKNPRGERRNKKTNEVRIAIPLEDIPQTKGMHLKDAANLLRVSQSTLKYACPEYGIPRWPPHKLISQSHPEETPALVDQEGIPQLNSDTLPSNQALGGTIDTRVVVKGIHPPLFLPTVQQDNLDEDFGDEIEVVAMGSEGIGEGEMEEDQTNSRYLRKMKMKEKISGGERGNKKTTGVRIAIPLEDILQTKEMPLKDAAKHLKVSKSTLKRACREYDIPRWPPRGEHKLINQSCPNEPPAVVDKEQIPQLNSDTLLPSNQVSATIGTKSVIVKARFGSATMKFQLSWPWGMKELNEQVKKRLGDEAKNYHINYKDEDDEYIMIGCDEDLQDHISRSNLLRTNWIEVFLQPK